MNYKLIGIDWAIDYESKLSAKQRRIRQAKITKAFKKALKLYNKLNKEIQTLTIDTKTQT